MVLNSLYKHFVTRKKCFAFRYKTALTAIFRISTCAVTALGLLTFLPAVAQVTPQTVTGGLQNPWAMAFLPDGNFLVTERPGRLRLVTSDGKLQPTPITGLPPIDAGGQGGLLDVLLDSEFARNRTLYFCFSEPAGTGSGNSTALAQATLSVDNTRLENLRILFSQKPKFASSAHFGCRIVEGRTPGVAGNTAAAKTDGTLFLTLGDRFSRRDDAQKLDNHHGKIVRINKGDGSIPAAGNPFTKQAGALPEIWSYGHRNVQGATTGPDGRLWTHEHGPQGGDEINIAQAGLNYGWPIITFGENYGGGTIGAGITARAGLETPLHQWTPSIAPSGMAFLTSNRYGTAWQGNLFVGSLKFGYLNRIELQGGSNGSAFKVVKESKLLDDLDERIRDVRQGPDGLLYVLTDSRQGQLIRLLPR